MIRAYCSNIYTVSLGLPPRPLPDVDLSALDVANLEPFPEAGLLEQFPKCEDVGVRKSKFLQNKRPRSP